MNTTDNKENNIEIKTETLPAKKSPLLRLINCMW